MFSVQVTINGKPVGSGGFADALQEAVVDAASAQIADQVKSVVCPVHGKPAAGVDVDFTDDLEAGRIKASGLCCDELKAAIEAALTD